MRMEATTRRTQTFAALVGTAALLVAVSAADTAPAATKQGKIHACYAKKGADKGAMRFVRGKKCARGEKSVRWNKRGKAGPAGPAGPAGAGASATELDALRQLITTQSAQITTLQNELATLSGQLDALRTQACAQLSALTAQSNALRTVFAGLGVNGALTALAGALVIPALPAALPNFSCS